MGDDPAHRPFLPALLLDFPAIIFASSVTDQHHVTAGRQEQLRWLCYFSLSCDQCFASAAPRHRPPTTTKPPRPPILGGPTQRDFCYRRNKDQSTLSSHFSTHRINPARGKRTGEGLGVGEGGTRPSTQTSFCSGKDKTPFVLGSLMSASRFILSLTSGWSRPSEQLMLVGSHAHDGRSFTLANIYINVYV